MYTEVKNSKIYVRKIAYVKLRISALKFKNNHFLLVELIMSIMLVKNASVDYIVKYLTMLIFW